MRIVSLVPSITASVVALGRGADVVGVSSYCPTEGLPAGVSILGGPKDVTSEQVLALKPDLILAGEAENDPSLVRELSGRRGTLIARCRGIAEAKAFVLALGQRLNRLRLAERFMGEFDRVAGLATSFHRPPRRVFYPVWKNPWIAAGPDSFCGRMLQLAGAYVIAPGEGDYPRVDLQRVLKEDPEVVLLPDEPYHFTVFDAVHFSGTRAARLGAVRTVPGQWAAWYGTMMAEGLKGLYSSIHGVPLPG
ncbi:MAG: hypothetical protein DRN14_04980 [Thermoplasmata archaeon]|nr:MAG: hypothetical protein DRN14_04980 [Thermoplasmata archaeon]